MNQKDKFRWECHHDTGSGLDRECCNAKGGWSTLETAIKNGKKHNDSHSFCGWGYPPLGWKNQTVNIYKKAKSGWNKVVVKYNEL